VERSTPWAKSFLQQWPDRKRTATAAVRAAWDALWGDDGGATHVVVAVTRQLLHANRSAAFDAVACMRSVHGGEEQAGSSSLQAVDAAAVAACSREQLQACCAPLVEPRSLAPLCLPPARWSDGVPPGRHLMGDLLSGRVKARARGRPTGWTRCVGR
jgi:hypothetical protein